jgi:hypothetical protein
VKHLLTVIILTVASTSVAQGIVSGGVRVNLHEVVMEATLERPSIDVLGVRWGPILSARARIPMPTGHHVDTPSVNVLAGVSGTIATNPMWAVQVQILTRAALEVGSSRFTPELVLVYTRRLGAPGAP